MTTEYMLSVHHREGDPERSSEAMQQAFGQVDKFNTEVMEAGLWVFAGGLHPPATATVVTATGGETVLTDGPFAESKEHLGGFWVIRADDLDAALEWAGRASAACMEPVEVRPFQDGEPQD